LRYSALDAASISPRNISISGMRTIAANAGNGQRQKGKDMKKVIEYGASVVIAACYAALIFWLLTANWDALAGRF